MLENPTHLLLDCDECKQFVYDIETCKPKLRRGQKMPRPPGTPLPCRSCPKKSPERWKQIKPSRRTLETLDLYRKSRSTSGRCLTRRELADQLLLRNFALLDAIFRGAESNAVQRAVSDLVTVLRRNNGR